ncbi:MAG: twin-arginine translocase subunit TatC [Bacteroidales bacterium]|jgi:sec-independent protein translocase protein TatC|nr:twin-arginine translocase subunit TatC [Bacteroidales bacterium]
MATEGGRKGKNDREMTFLEHLEELRWHIIRSFISIFITAVVAFIFKDIIFDKIILSIKDPDFLTNRLLCQLGEIVDVKALCINRTAFEIINIKMAGLFTTHITISLISGIILAFPYIFWEFWRFFRPALYENEYSHARGAVLYSSILFITGVLFGYFVIAPLSIHFLSSYSVSSQVSNQIFLRSYIGTITSISLAGGLVFELPVVIYFLSRIGIVTPRFLRKYRRHSIIVILLLAAIITPPDIFSQVLVCLPLLVLYEIGIFISARVEKRRRTEDKKREEELSSMRHENGSL